VEVIMLEPRRKCGLGWRPDLPDFRDHIYRATVAPTLPTHAVPVRAEVRDVHRFPVFDQAQTNSCVGHAVAELHAIVRKVVPRSRLQVYYEARRIIGETDRDEGAYIRDAIKVIAQLGAGRESWWPFDPDEITVDPPEKVDRDALKRRVFSYSRLLGGDDYRLCLASGFPFVIGISCYDNLFSPAADQAGIYAFPQPGERNQGGHAILIYGYDDDFATSPWAQAATAKGFAVPGRGLSGAQFVGHPVWHGRQLRD
jgi:hypothetical protein